MWAKKLLPYMALGISLYLSSCQKDALLEESSISSETISSEATIDNTVETKPALWASYTTSINANVAGFWQGVPALYSQTTKKYPLIIFIHGIGELGTNLSKMNCCGLPHHLNNKSFPANFNVNGQNFSFITVAPQFKKRPSAAEVQSVIDFAKNRFRIDPARVYVTGLSMGGGSTWDWSAVYGQNAAAIVPVCGGTAASTGLSQKIASKNLPFWALYSTKDALVPASWGTNFLNWIKQYNSAISGKLKLTIWTDADHNATWARAFNPNTKIDGKNIYEWLLLFTRGGASGPVPVNPAKPATGNKAPVARAGADQTVPVEGNHLRINGTLSSDPDGWLTSIKWTQISGPKKLTLVNPASSNTLVTGLVAGNYVFRVTVTDNKGAVSYDDTKITITKRNVAPVAKAGADQTLPASWGYLRLNGATSHDTDGWVSKFQWKQLSGPKWLTLLTPSSVTTLVKGGVPGKYVFRLSVTDDKGTVSYDDVVVNMTNK
jgi:dienelactone hydrolase